MMRKRPINLIDLYNLKIGPNRSYGRGRKWWSRLKGWKWQKIATEVNEVGGEFDEI